MLVVGSGAAGAALCASLGARGLDVVCLEQGPWYPPGERPKAFPDWEVRDRRAWSPLVDVRAAPCDYPVRSVGDDEVLTMMYSAVGGSTVGYGGHFWRLSPSDFRLESSEAFGVDWPIGYDELAPYYTLNERITGVSGLAGDPTGPPRASSLHPPLPIGPAGERFADAFERLGWRWWVPDQAIVSRPHAGRPACTNRGFCRLGCPQGSLSTADLTYWPRAITAGVELHTGCAVSELVLAQDGRVRGALYHDAGGRAHEVGARVSRCARTASAHRGCSSCLDRPATRTASQTRVGSLVGTSCCTSRRTPSCVSRTVWTAGGDRSAWPSPHGSSARPLRTAASSVDTSSPSCAEGRRS